MREGGGSAPRSTKRRNSAALMSSMAAAVVSRTATGLSERGAGISDQTFLKRQPLRQAPNAERALEVGHQVRSICTPWDEGDFEDGWFGGMIDGEGSISLPSRCGASISVAQRAGSVWDRMLAYGNRRGYAHRTEIDKRKAGDSSKLGQEAVYKICFTRMDDLFRLIGQTRPSRMIGNRFWEGKEMPGKRNADNSAWNEIVSIEPVGMMDMIDLQTSTGTFIAEGMVSHNTTLVSILWLDHALFVPSQRVGIIAHKIDDAEVIFRDKVRFAYDNMPELLRLIMPLKKATESTLIFAHNGSSIRVSTSMRSGTIHRLHISELGKIAAESPKKAMEIKTGSLPAVPDTGIAIIESTAEGKAGYFYEISTRAEKRAQVARPLGRKEFRFHFYPWHAMPQYRAPEGDRTPISPTQHKYFDDVERQMGIKLDIRQRRWYVSTLEHEQAGDAESMWREYPSTPEECWQKSNAGTYYTPQINRARAEGRIGTVPFVSHVPVHTFWDIGSGDGTAIWCMQRVGMQHRFPLFLEDWAKGYSHYVNALRETGQVFGTHYLPHDAGHERQLQYRVGKPIELLQELAPDWTFQMVPRVSDLQHGITLTRDVFHTCWFDAEGCKEGIAHLEAYHKKYSTRVQDWTDEPEKDDGHSEAADAFRQFAQGFDAGTAAANPYETLARIRRRAPTH